MLRVPWRFSRYVSRRDSLKSPCAIVIQLVRSSVWLYVTLVSTAEFVKFQLGPDESEMSVGVIGQKRW